MIVHGIKENSVQFYHQLIQVFFVGITLGTVRTVVPALAEDEFAVATKELGVVQNKSPGFKKRALQANNKAELPLLTAIAYLLLTRSFIFFSNSTVLGP